MTDSDKKRFAASAQSNREPILECLKGLLTSGDRVLEIGSGTGQHACYFARQFPKIVWQPTELAENIPVINQWLRDEALANVEAPVLLDVSQLPWPVKHADIVYTCNTFHIMSESCVESLFAGAAEVLDEGGRLIVYGPFIIDGKPMVASNDNFDQLLRQQNASQGIRDTRWLNTLAGINGFSEASLQAMPSNNTLAVWSRLARMS